MFTAAPWSQKCQFLVPRAAEARPCCPAAAPGSFEPLPRVGCPLQNWFGFSNQINFDSPLRHRRVSFLVPKIWGPKNVQRARGRAPRIALSRFARASQQQQHHDHLKTKLTILIFKLVVSRGAAAAIGLNSFQRFFKPLAGV
jgi:hypothetical protein